MADSNQAQLAEVVGGLTSTANLVEAEQQSWRRWAPFAKMPWHALRKFEAEIERLERRRQETERERLAVMEELRLSPERDAEALAQWQRDGGQSSSRPEPSGPKLQERLTELQEDERALLGAVDSVAKERVNFVERDRARLTKDAAQAEEKALERAHRALRELEEARASLVEARRLRRWTELYPAQEVAREPRWGLLGGGLKCVLQKLGLENVVTAEQVYEAVRDDLSWIADAASPEQRQRLEPRPISQDERERARDSHLNGAARLRGQLAHDRRVGELESMRGRLR